MKDQFTLILEDGSRHEVTADLSFEVVGHQKLAKGTIEEGDIGTLFDAMKSGRILLETKGGHQHPISITGGGETWFFRGVS